ncbi:MAG: NUDIX domain-containing protein [Clostridia bacterium]|nr:NUDIX domain-containing protein [Clostridia bacterium]
MKQLFVIDLKDYNDGDEIVRRPSARGIIFKNNKIALVYSKKEKYYKFPGGGINDNEDKKAALIREIREEVGLVVIPDTIFEFGTVMRRQKSNFSANKIFEQENFYYFCEVEEKKVEQDLDDYEKDAEFVLEYVDLAKAIKTNSAFKSDDFFDEIMIQRDTKVLQMIKETITN